MNGSDASPQILNGPCAACPRTCSAFRKEGRGFCRETEGLRLAWAGLHFGEEPPLTVTGGSGAIFITGCNLHCAFCQNWQISQEGMGAPVTPEEFSRICLELQRRGAENINIITGSHASAEVASGLALAKRGGLRLPVCWNSSSYETVEGLDLLAGLVDIWLPDLKTLDTEFARRYFSAPDYPDVAKKALVHMASLSPFRFGEKEGRPKMLSGVLVRHLVMPGRLGDTEEILDWFDGALRGDAELSLMTQYTPILARAERLHSLSDGGDSFESRFLGEDEYDRLRRLLDEHGLPGGYFQELSTDDSWLPDFSHLQPFSDAMAKTVWHWREGFVSSGERRAEAGE